MIKLELSDNIDNGLSNYINSFYSSNNRFILRVLKLYSYDFAKDNFL